MANIDWRWIRGSWSRRPPARVTSDLSRRTTRRLAASTGTCPGSTSLKGSSNRSSDRKLSVLPAWGVAVRSRAQGAAARRAGCRVARARTAALPEDPYGRVDPHQAKEPALLLGENPPPAAPPPGRLGVSTKVTNCHTRWVGSRRALPPSVCPACHQQVPTLRLSCNPRPP